MNFDHELFGRLHSFAKTAPNDDPLAATAMDTMYSINSRECFLVAVLGPSGAGKSAVVNFITNSSRTDPAYSPLNCRHRDYTPRVHAWHALRLIDIPEIPPSTSPRCHYQSYLLQHMNLLIFVGQDGRISPVDMELIQLTQQQDRPAMYINTRMDLSCANYRHDHDLNSSESDVFDQLKRAFLSSSPFNSLNLPVSFVDVSTKKPLPFLYDNHRCLQQFLDFVDQPPTTPMNIDDLPSSAISLPIEHPQLTSPTSLPSLKEILLPSLRPFLGVHDHIVPLPPQGKVIQPVNPAGKWTQDEDDRLRAGIEIHGPRNWKAIASMVRNRNHAQCLQRWRKVLLPGLRRGNWTCDEDVLLQAQIRLHGGHDKLNWSAVAGGVPGRTAKHCQERWRNYLNPAIKRGPFDGEELDQLLGLYELWGNQWTRISDAIPGRCPVDCKTTWQSMHPQHKLNPRPGPGRPKRFG
ncbi:hypothetical protein H257_01617 [Aphanomyces astaci]|uniref:Uncharacterized protein n=1 Tax=Aphanomyces astaci TaxID=112090 RepID=W4HAP2_APHAT|nr:hypothetical protein H257_01617 [Aphanomyces astaci]ETV88354.1 hypothetical protein H257_01617 [Aphanomyces astaci]|eukprot:XP_009823217.1 hypothetical protein H257_01617 [Aphanomyces astaci]